MFWSKKDTIKEYDYTDDLKAILQTRNLQIAISRSEVRARYGFPMYPSTIIGNSYEISTETDLLGSSGLLRGVIHFQFHRDQHIPATVRFCDEAATNGMIGEFLLFKPTHGHPPIGDPSIIYQNLLLELTIHDKDARIFNSIQESMRDACLSSKNFLHIDFVIAEINSESFFSELEKTSRARVPVTSIGISDVITLSLAPAWSWNWY
jgi:hypothetical protein